MPHPLITALRTIPRQALLPVLPVLVVGLIGCSEATQQEYSGEDYPAWVNNLVGAQPAVADEPGWQPEHSEPSSEAFITTSSGQLSTQQVERLLYLQWPQSKDAMHSLLGGPKYTDPLAGEEYWVMPNGHTLALYYAGGKATGYSLGDSAW